MTVIGIIGAGEVGSNIARAAIDSGYNGCFQSNRNSSLIGAAIPYPLGAQAMRLCHSDSAAERRVL